MEKVLSKIKWIKTAYLNGRHRVLVVISRWLLKRSWAAAMLQAKKIKDTTGQKVWIFLMEGDFTAMTKQDFKALWQKRPALKIRTIQEWQKFVHEY